MSEPAGWIVAPSLGRPAFLRVEERHLDAWVLCRGQAPPTDRFLTRRVGDKGATSKVSMVACGEYDRLPDQPFDLRRLEPGARLWRVSLSVDQWELGGAPWCLFDLVHPDLEAAWHSVAVRVQDWTDWRFVYFADPHVAEAWDAIESMVASAEGASHADPPFSGQALRDGYFNPNKALAELVRRVNELASRGEVDLVICGGDLVDYVYRRPRRHPSAGYEGTNFELFERLVTGRHAFGEELRVPLLTITGNHDYRLYPYRLFSYGLRHCGLHHVQTGILTGEVPRLPRWIPTLEDIDSIRASGGRRHSLRYYLLRINAALDYSLPLGDLRIVGLDTGRDVVLAAARLAPKRLRSLVRSVLFGGDDPDSEGLDDRQISLLKERTSDPAVTTVLLLFHAGLLNTFPYAPVDPDAFAGDSGPARLCDSREYRFPLNVADAEGGGLGLERELARAGLRNGCIFRNQGAVIREALTPGRGFFGLSGHVHRCFEIRADRATGDVFNQDYTSAVLQPDPGSAYFLSPNALGHPQPKYEVANTPEYYLARVLNGTLESIARESLRQGRLAALSMIARVVERHPGSLVMEVEIELRSDELLAIEERLDLILWILVIGKKGQVQRGPVRVHGGSGRPLPAIRGPIGSARVDALLDITRFRKEDRFQRLTRLTIDHASSATEEIAIAFEVRDPLEGQRPLQVAWHPRSFKL